MTGKTGNYMIGKTRHLYNRNVRIFPRVMPVGCLHLPSSIVNVLANEQRGSLSSLFLTKSMNNESASFVQMGHPYRAFPRNHIRTNFRVPMVPTESSSSSYGSQSSYDSHGAQSLHSSHSAYSSYGSYGSSYSYCYYCYYCFYANKRVNSTGSHPQRAVKQGSPVSSVQSVQFRQFSSDSSISQFESVSSSHSIKSDGRSQTVEVKQSKSNSRSLFIRSFG